MRSLNSESNDEEDVPAPKKAKPAAKSNLSMTDFFSIIPSAATATSKPKPAPKPRVVSGASSKASGPSRKKAVTSEDDDDVMEVDDEPPAREARRPARAAATSSKKYAVSSDAVDTDQASAFEDSD